ncbi:recombinase family protein [Paludisphaera sp.]|uniref:recombinase family protein n=1 Tax=Paludisphaera sp. TaxID=2017432 RepID=UPI00301E4361
MTAAVVYLRVSTDDQAGEGVSLRAQEADCRAFAAREGLPVAAVHSDPGISGATPINARPGLRAAVDALGPGDVLVAYNRSRLFRADPLIVALIELEVSARGARIKVAANEGTGSDSAADVLTRRMMDAVSEHWKNSVREGTRRAREEKREAGERWGQIAYGTKLAEDGIHLVPAPEDAGLVEAVERLRAEGLSYRKIAEALPGLGYRPKEGAERWSHTSVRRLLGKVKPWRAAKRARELAAALGAVGVHPIPRSPDPCPPPPPPPASSTSSATPSTPTPAASTKSPPPPRSPASPSAGSSAASAA